MPRSDQTSGPIGGVGASNAGRPNRLLTNCLVLLCILLFAALCVVGWLAVRSALSLQVGQAKLRVVDLERMTEQKQRKTAEGVAKSALEDVARGKQLAEFLFAALTDHGRPVSEDGVLLHEALDGATRRLDEGALKDSDKVECEARRIIGESYRSLGDFAGAEPHLEAVLAIRRELHGETSVPVLEALWSLASLAKQRDDENSAHALRAELLAVYGQLIDEKPHGKVPRLYGAIDANTPDGNYGPAVPQLRWALRLLKEQFGDQHPHTLAGYRRLAAGLVDAGDFKEAESFYLKALGQQRAMLPPDHPDVAPTLAGLGSLRLRQEKYTEAEALLRESIAVREKADPDLPVADEAKSLLGETLARQGKYEEAEPLLLSAYDRIKRDKEAPVHRKRRARLRIVDLYERWGKKELAAKYQRGASQEPATSAPAPNYSVERG